VRATARTIKAAGIAPSNALPVAPRRAAERFRGARGGRCEGGGVCATHDSLTPRLRLVLPASSVTSVTVTVTVTSSAAAGGGAVCTHVTKVQAECVVCITL
jgi:hypothetical protein